MNEYEKEGEWDIRLRISDSIEKYIEHQIYENELGKFERKNIFMDVFAMLFGGLNKRSQNDVIDHLKRIYKEGK